MTRAIACLALFVAACAPSMPHPYLEARAAAERAYSAGRYDEAAQHWQAAERAAEHRRDKLEARYRAAASLRRAGRSREAERLLESISSQAPRSERAARAAYDRADLEIEQGDRDKGYRMLERMFHDYPKSGIAAHALTRYLTRLDELGGPDRVLAYIERATPALATTELAETLAYQKARYLEQAHRDPQALAQYLEVARRFPYPRGALWDDALWNASLIEERLGRPEAAVAHLKQLLAEMEPSHLQGSYQRPRYDDAQYRIALLYRDKLGDPTRARNEFRKVWTEHPTSVLRDDALWNEAVLAKRQGDERGACKTLARLVDDIPDSRFAACTRALCRSVAPKRDGKCHDYILRELDGH